MECVTPFTLEADATDESESGEGMRYVASPLFGTSRTKPWCVGYHASGPSSADR